MLTLWQETAWKKILSMASACALLVTLVGCGSVDPSWHLAGDPAGRSSSDSGITIVEPTADAIDVPTSTEIVYRTTDASSSAVELRRQDPSTSPSQAPARSAESLSGTFREDGSSWVPSRQLSYSTSYRVTVSAVVRGKPRTESITFTTMAEPASTIRVSSVIGDDQVVGVGMPIVLVLGGNIEPDQRTVVQRRLFVSSDPPQEGAWNWFNAHEIHFRPRTYWKESTRLTFRAALGGFPLGDGVYGANDVAVTAAVGDKVTILIDNLTKQMTVSRGNATLRTIPVSLGKPSSPSASGNFVIMSKRREEWFDSSTYGVPASSPDGYRTLVRFAQRLTWDGEYIHAADWSEAAQGRRNVSHGCTNISEANAEWLFSLTHVGDPVVIVNTEEHVTWGNGYTDWDIDFAEYASGGPRTSASPDASPSRT